MGETVFTFDSTLRGMKWRRKNFAGARPIVRWIDDRNEANRLGVTVDELQVARRVKAVLSDDDPVTEFRFPFKLHVEKPRYHRQTVGIVS